MYRHTEFDEPMDGIIYAAAAGLGFASIENILYVLEGGASVGIIRAITSVPGHVIFSCIWGFALGTAKFRPASQRTGIIFMGLSGAIQLHAIYNFSAEYFQALGLLLTLVVFMPFGWLITCRNIRFAHADPASACSALNRIGSHDTSLSDPVLSSISSDPVKDENYLDLPEQHEDEINFNAP